MKYRIVIIGGGESGVGAAYLANKKGYEVFLSDYKKIEEKYRNILLENEIDFEEGGHSIEKFYKANEIIKSPGISEESELILKIKSKKIPIVSEIEFAFRFTSSIIISVTGSNGKTTTSSLIYHILKKSGLNVGLAGNIGNSFSFLIAENEFDYVVLELSSFQLDNINHFNSFISVLTNISPDHLERYDYNFENYVDSKFKINSTKISFSTTDNESLNKGCIKNQAINININNNNLMIPIENLSLQGNHNIQNSMAAATVAKILNISDNNIRESLGNFKSIEHRLEHVLTIQKVKYVNDSKATNVNAVYYALDSMKSSTVWIVGGVDKGNNYEELLPLVREKVKAIICIGIDNSKIIQSFSPFVEKIIECSKMSDAVKNAYRMADPKDTVLLSPAFTIYNSNIIIYFFTRKSY